jgi:hypothetical protein
MRLSTVGTVPFDETGPDESHFIGIVIGTEDRNTDMIKPKMEQ